MSESQNIEWKNSWRDEYIKWICAFANANGGILEIGKDDNGIIVGISNARKLMEDLPNKIRNVLGIIVDVNLHSSASKEWIAIHIEPHPYPVSYKGQYHYRSGSTKQELRGAALDRFLLQKQGKKWDSIPVPYVSTKNLTSSAFQYFRKKATQTKRLDVNALKGNDDLLLDRLHLKGRQYLKRAAVLSAIPKIEFLPIT